MTTYYISPSGSNSNNGLGPDASDSTNKPWLTLKYAMETAGKVAPGDIVRVGPGNYFDTVSINPIAAICSAGSPTQIVGDPTNEYGFKNGSGVRLSPALPWLLIRSSTELDATTANAGNSFFELQTNDPNGLQFKKLGFNGKGETFGGYVCFDVEWDKTTDLLIEDCVFAGFGAVLRYFAGTVPTAGRNHTFRRITLFGGSVILVQATVSAAATADADLAIVIENSLLIGNLFSSTFSLGTAGGNKAGGILVRDNTIFPAASSWFATTASCISIGTPIRYRGNLIIGGQPVNAGTSGQIIDDGYNKFFGNASNTNVTPGTQTVFGPMPNVILPYLITFGLELPRTDWFGWTDAAHANQKFSASGSTTPDFRGRTARPWGAGASIGCWQAQDVVQDTSSAITGGGTNSLKITGAGEVSLYIPVDATGFTVSVRTKSTSYGGTNYPQMVVVANPGVGVTADTTVTAAAATEETITTATITPTSKGVMEVRLISRSTSTTSTTHFDILTSA